MKKKLTWQEKTDLLIMCPSISLRQIQSIFDIGQPTATEIREKTLKLAKEYGRWVGDKKVPTDLVLVVMGLDFDYFKKMIRNERNLENDLLGA